jgi:hypothetical protein
MNQGFAIQLVHRHGFPTTHLPRLNPIPFLIDLDREVVLIRLLRIPK